MLRGKSLASYPDAESKLWSSIKEYAKFPRRVWCVVPAICLWRANVCDARSFPEQPLVVGDQEMLEPHLQRLLVCPHSIVPVRWRGSCGVFLLDMPSKRYVAFSPPTAVLVAEPVLAAACLLLQTARLLQIHALLGMRSCTYSFHFLRLQ